METVSGTELNFVCRVCLDEDSTMTNLFMFSPKMECSVADALIKCAPVQVTKDDSLPKSICETCFSELKRAYRFQKLASQSETILHEKLKAETIDPITVEQYEESDPSEDDDANETADKQQQDIEVKPSISTVLLNIDRRDEDEMIYLSADKKRFVCNVCDKLFNYKQSLKRHKRLHTGERPYHCDKCNRSFNHLSYFKEHQFQHSSNKPHKCDICQDKFSRLKDLVAHKRGHNTGPYVCYVCYRSFRIRQSLDAHKRIEHTDEKPYACETCNKRFAVSSNLTNHRRIHTGEKPYMCDVCSRCFAEAGALKKHKRVHSGERPFKCDVCDKGFSVSSSLNRHRFIHMKL